MRLIRYILFIPALFAGMFLSRIISNVILFILKLFDSGISLPIWSEFLTSLIAVTIGIEISLIVYPKKNKRISLAIIGFVLLVIILLSSYSVFGIDVELGESTRSEKITILISAITYLVIP